MNVSVGQKLRRAREEQELTLGEVAEATHIRLHYLQAMEAGDFETLPSPVQKRGFLRAYASFLGLESKPLLEALERGPEPVFSPIVKGTPTPPEEAVPSEREEPPQGEDEAAFREVGQKLRAQREILGLSLEDIERHTHLRTHYLRALEAGDLASLPSTVQGRGMLNNYAKFLGLDPEPLLLRFGDGLQARLARAHPETRTGGRRRRKRTKPAGPVRRFFSRDLIFGGLLVVFLVAFAVWGGLQILSLRSAQEATPTQPSIAAVLLPSPTSTISPSASPTLAGDAQATTLQATPQPAAEVAVETTLTPLGEGPVQVQVIVRQRAWMRVIADGEITFEGRVIPGSAHAFAGEEQIEILTGNGEGLQVIFNQEDQGVMGVFGEVVHRVYTLGRVLTPTASVTPTETATPRFSPTPTSGP